MSIQAANIKSNLRALNSFDPVLRREITKELKGLMKPAVDAANQQRAKIKSVEGFNHNGRTGAGSDKAIIARVDTRKARRRNLAKGAQYESLAVLKVQTKGTASAIADMAGRKGQISTTGRSRSYPGRPNGHALNGQGGFLIDKLDREFGRSGSRFMWPAVESTIANYEQELTAIVRKVEEAVNKEMMKIR
jgi:hypothetical protein